MLVKKLYIFLVIQVISCAVDGHEQKSLAFVVDTTSSMLSVIRQIIETVDIVFDAVLKSNESRIEDFILVTFDDPRTEIKCLTKDKNEFKKALESIIVSNGGDCPEYSMSGIEEALKISKPNSFIYVFTDASAKDYDKIDLVRSLSQEKGIQITFILTGMCRRYAKQHYNVYKQLTEATSGQIFHMEPNNVNKFTIDSKISDVVIAVSSNSPNYRVTDSDGNVIETKEIVHTEKSAVDKMKANPGVYTISINNDYTSSDSSVVVSGSTTVSFRYGFSFNEPTSLNETSTKPVEGFTEDQYLSIELDNSERDVQLETAELRDINDNILKVLKLKVINEEKQLYRTEAFKPPHGILKIAINGSTKSKEKITRVSASTVGHKKIDFDEI